MSVAGVISVDALLPLQYCKCNPNTLERNVRMKITDIQVIYFKTKSRTRPTKFGYYYWADEHDTISSITKIVTDEGAEGYNLGGDRATIERLVKPLLVGEDPLQRRKAVAVDDQLQRVSGRCKVSMKGLSVSSTACSGTCTGAWWACRSPSCSAGIATGSRPMPAPGPTWASPRTMPRTPWPARPRGTRPTRCTPTSI